MNNVRKPDYSQTGIDAESAIERRKFILNRNNFFYDITNRFAEIKF